MSVQREPESTTDPQTEANIASKQILSLWISTIKELNMVQMSRSDRRRSQYTWNQFWTIADKV